MTHTHCGKTHAHVLPPQGLAHHHGDGCMAGSASAARPYTAPNTYRPPANTYPAKLSDAISRCGELIQVQLLMVIPIIAAVQRQVRVVQAPITIIVNLKRQVAAAMRMQAMVQVVVVQVTTVTLHQIRPGSSSGYYDYSGSSSSTKPSYGSSSSTSVNSNYTGGGTYTVQKAILFSK